MVLIPSVVKLSRRKGFLTPATQKISFCHSRSIHPTISIHSGVHAEINTRMAQNHPKSSKVSPKRRDQESTPISIPKLSPAITKKHFQCKALCRFLVGLFNGFPIGQCYHGCAPGAGLARLGTSWGRNGDRIALGDGFNVFNRLQRAFHVTL